MQTPYQAALERLRHLSVDTQALGALMAAVEPLLAEAQHTQALLHTTQTTLESLVQNYPGGIVSVFDTDMRHVLVGGETAADHGFDPARMIGKTPSEFRAGEPADNLESLIWRTLQGESVRELDYDDAKATLIISTPVFEGQRVVGAIVVGQNVTDLVQLQEEKFEQERARATLEKEIATARARSHIIDQVLHEIRNPLASLASSAELLETYGDRMSAEKRADHLQRILNEVRALGLAMSHLAQITE